MKRSSLFSAAVLCSMFVVSCEKAADQQQKAINAQAEANEKVVEVAKDANQKMVNAQAEADKKVAEAQANFLKMREDYRHKRTVDLVELDRKVEELEAKAKKAKDKEKAEIENRVKQIRVSRASFATEYQKLETATGETWDATKSRLDKEWDDLKAMVDKL